MAGRLRPLSPFWLSGSLGPIGEPTPCPARRGRAVGVRRWDAVLRPPSCACNGRGVSSSNLFAQNANWSQARVSDGPRGDKTLRSHWILLRASQSNSRQRIMR
jgi:hypothetical protein